MNVKFPWDCQFTLQKLNTLQTYGTAAEMTLPWIASKWQGGKNFTTNERQINGILYVVFR